MIVTLFAILSILGHFGRAAVALVQLAWTITSLAFCFVGWVVVGVVWLVVSMVRCWRWLQEWREGRSVSRLL